MIAQKNRDFFNVVPYESPTSCEKQLWLAVLIAQGSLKQLHMHKVGLVVLPALTLTAEVQHPDVFETDALEPRNLKESNKTLLLHGKWEDSHRYTFQSR